MNSDNQPTTAAKIYDQEGNLHPFVMRYTKTQNGWLDMTDTHKEPSDAA